MEKKLDPTLKGKGKEYILELPSLRVEKIFPLHSIHNLKKCYSQTFSLKQPLWKLEGPYFNPQYSQLYTTLQKICTAKSRRLVVFFVYTIILFSRGSQLNWAQLVRSLACNAMQSQDFSVYSKVIHPKYFTTLDKLYSSAV